MPWENTWLAAPTRYQAIRRALKTAGVQVKDINVTLGGCAFWHAVVSIRKQAGEGKNALLAALSVMDLKHVVVVDDDIDVFDPMDVEWAIATRVQADRDVVVISGARAKPLDPSLPITPPGVVPTGAKVGIDATIGEGIPRERFERIAYAYADRAKISDYLAGKGDAAPAEGSVTPQRVATLAEKIQRLIETEPKYYQDIAAHFSDYDFQTVARALGALHAQQKLWQDARGRLCLRGSAFAAKPPARS
jgi:2,5-furandicarboxylate decarboxylase 1